MKVCNTCRSQVNDSYTVCPNCGNQNLTVQPDQQPMQGQPVGGYQQPMYNQPAQNEKGNIGYGVLGFFIPIAGLILYLIWKDTKPADAKMAGKGALISVIVSVVFYILYFIIIGIMIAGIS